MSSFKNIAIAILFVCCSCIVFAEAPLQPANLTCEYVNNPICIDVMSPKLSWILTSIQKNQLQSGYEIIVSDNENEAKKGKGNCWESGKVLTTKSIHISYAGKALMPFTKYYWRVKVYDQQGISAEWSAMATFETAMLNQSDWTGKWISDGSSNPVKDEDYYKQDRMPLLKKEFSVKKKLAGARLYISGMGYYEAYLNGKKIGNHVLDPGFTTYIKQAQYVVYDVTALINKGTNVTGVMLGNGWWNPLPFKLFGRWDLRDYQQTGRPCVKAVLLLQYKDGTTEKINTDESWLSAPGPIIHNNIYLGETYDARLEQDWNSSATNWKAAVAVPGPSGMLTAQMQPAIKITKVIRPIKITEQGRDTFIVDMGQNFAGVAAIKVTGAAGDKISLRYGEALYKDGRLNYMTTVVTQIKKGGIKGGPGAPETAWQQDDYILKGKGMETWQPRFTFHGFRYVEITGWPGRPTLADIEGLRMNSDLEINGSFECANPMFNQLHEVIKWTFLSNVFSVQSDCPAREKMGYGGDMVATANSFIYNYNMANFYSKAVNDFANEQRPMGGITEIAPFTGIADRGYGDGSGPLGWELAFPFLQKQLYDFYGDEQIIQQYYEAFKKQLSFLESKAEEGMFYWDISDHEALDTKPEALTASCFYYHHLLLAIEFASILHQQNDSLKFAKQAAQLKNKIINKYLVKGTGRVDNATQSAQLFALYYNVTTEKENSFKVLMDEFKRHDDHLATGIFSTKMMFDVLREKDSVDLAYKIADQRTYPGWGFMLQEGATTLWETWQYPETGPSQNHPMFGSVDEWFYRSLLGINPAAPGFEKIIIKPQVPQQLEWAKGNYHSIRGNITSDWKKTPAGFLLHVIIPANTTATIWMPAKNNAAITESEKALIPLRYEKGYAVIETGSGEYFFTSSK
ncbi:glycoside hydrolase family 78 protein [soil metagenome]